MRINEEKVLAKLKELSQHNNVKLVNCGNAAIFAALYIAKKINSKPYILIPDQGGWISFQTYPKILGFEIIEVKTNKGIIDLKHLEEVAPKGAAFFVTSFAGYFAEQPMKHIAEVCKKNGCLLVEDASGAIGDSVLCNGTVSDIVIGSFGKWKPVNYKEGGFIAVSDSDYFEKTKEMYSILRYKPNHKRLLKKLEKVKDRINFFLETSKKIKLDLKEFNIFHADKRGLNVVVGFENEQQKEKIIEYCKEKEYNFLVCPKYIRVNEDAISIEVKRMPYGEDEEDNQGEEE